MRIATQSPVWCVALAAALLASAAVPASAQVGFEPGRSPFHDLTTHQSLTFSVGYFKGNTAQPGVGWRRGAIYAGRFDTRLGGPFDLYVNVGFVGSSRFKINTTLDSASRTTGPFKKTLVVADLGLIVNLTGPKTWHGLAPYFGIGAGEVIPTATERDVGGYNAGTNFSFIPMVGTRWYLSKALSLRAEVRDYFFRYEWPLRYFAPVDDNNNSILPSILPSGAKDKQWAHNLTFTLGVAYGFNF